MPQMSFASRTELPGSGKKKSAPVCAHSACACQAGSAGVMVSMCMDEIVPGGEKRSINARSTTRSCP
jgi:hypothetical protein